MSKLDRAFIRAFNRDRAAPHAEPELAAEYEPTTTHDGYSPAQFDASSESLVEPAEVIEHEAPLPSIEELYGFPRSSGAETRILRADGPTTSFQSVPAPHASFDSFEEVVASRVEDEPLLTGFEDQLAATVSVGAAPVDGDLEPLDDTSTTERPASMRLFFGDDAPPPQPADEPPTDRAGKQSRSRPTLSLYRESSWEETWDAEPLDRGGLFGEAADEPPAAAFEVPRFTWPSMCETLIRSAGQLFESLAEALVTGSHEGHNRVVFTGARSGAGCTTIALAVARRLAADGHSVVLVDANWRHPQLAARLGMRPECGWREIVEDRLPVDEALVESRDDHLCLLPLVERADAPTAGLDAAALAGHVARLGRHYDLVLIDAGALDGAPAVGFELTSHLVNLADVAILVQDMRAAGQQENERLQETLDQAGLAWWGTVENFVPAA